MSVVVVNIVSDVVVGFSWCRNYLNEGRIPRLSHK